MRLLVTGSAGHLGEALVRMIQEYGHDVVGLDMRSSTFTSHVGSILDLDLVGKALRGVDVVIHAAALHKRHISKRSPRDFIDTNLSGTLALLEAALDANVSGMVFTSTTSAFGAALKPVDPDRANWIDEELTSVPKDIYGTTKRAAEDLCEWFFKTKGLPCIVLRVARFFPESDQNPTRLAEYADPNIKANEFLYRRVELDDAVDAHLKAAERVTEIGFGRYIVSATIPFGPNHLLRLRRDAPSLVRELFPDYEALYRERGWKMLPSIDRVYVNDLARTALGWEPRTNFRKILDRLRDEQPMSSALTRAVGIKGY